MCYGAGNERRGVGDKGAGGFRQAVPSSSLSPLFYGNDTKFKERSGWHIDFIGKLGAGGVGTEKGTGIAARRKSGNKNVISHDVNVGNRYGGYNGSCVYDNVKEGCTMKELQNFWREETAIGVVEIILILVILIALVLIFKGKITSVVNNAFRNFEKDSGEILG